MARDKEFFLCCSALVGLWIRVLHNVKVLKDVDGQRAISSTNLVDDKIFIWEAFEEIF